MPSLLNGKISLLGYACDLGTSHPGTEQGPQHLIDSKEMAHLTTMISDYECFYPSGRAHGLAAIPLLHGINARLAATTHQLTRTHRRFLTLGGDHTCAIGTWSGVATGLENQGDLGLIWFDAHLDSHTPQTTPSGNVHGMPLAALLGHGDPALTQLRTPTPKIKPEHVCVIGVRSFEPDELALLQQQQVRIFWMEEINDRGLEPVLADALAIATEGTAGFGISIDLDALDPEEAPGVGTPEPQGLATKPLLAALQSWHNHPKLIGLEIAEFNPLLDRDGRTEHLIAELIDALFSTTMP